MKLNGLIFLIGVFVYSSFSLKVDHEHHPLYFAMGEEWKAISVEQPVFTFFNQDSSLSHEVFLLKDTIDRALFFYAPVKTPVCIDGLCKPLHIKLYWNLIGEYIGYGFLNGESLTKFDHEVFEKKDYQKLHELLLNEKSVLREKKMEDLYDANATPQKKITFKGKEVDAVTGATKKEIKESVVEGALYSCFTLWHLVHGEMGKRMKMHFEEIASPSTIEQMLYSPYSNYQYYALRQLTQKDFEKHTDRILNVWLEAKPLTRLYILKKLPSSKWKEAPVSQILYENFSKVDVQTKTMLIQKLDHSHKLSIGLLAMQLKEMSKNQLKIYLDFLSSKDEVNPEVLPYLKVAMEDESFYFGYLIEDYLGF